MFLEETYIGTVDQEVCSHIEEPSLLLYAAPKVDSCPNYLTQKKCYGFSKMRFAR